MTCPDGKWIIIPMLNKLWVTFIKKTMPLFNLTHIDHVRLASKPNSSLTSLLSSNEFFLWLSKRKTHAGVLFALTINVRHVGFEIHLRTPACRHLRLIFLSGCQEEMQSRPALIFIENHFETVKKREVIRTELSNSSGFISLEPLNSQTVGLGKQPYRSPKVYRVSYFRSTWKNAWISAVEMSSTQPKWN